MMAPAAPPTPAPISAPRTRCRRPPATAPATAPTPAPMAASRTVLRLVTMRGWRAGVLAYVPDELPELRRPADEPRERLDEERRERVSLAAGFSSTMADFGSTAVKPPTGAATVVSSTGV